MNMSLYMVLMASIMMFTLFLMSLKWHKALMSVVLLEMGSILVISLIFLLMSSLGSLMMMLFSFFVCEALIMLSSMFNMLQQVGVVYGTVSFS